MQMKPTYVLLYRDPRSYRVNTITFNKERAYRAWERLHKAFSTRATNTNKAIMLFRMDQLTEEDYDRLDAMVSNPALTKQYDRFLDRLCKENSGTKGECLEYYEPTSEAKFEALNPFDVDFPTVD